MMNWNEYLAKGYKALDNAHLHFNVDGGTFEFDDDRDARQGATILGRLYGFDNVSQSGFNVIVNEPKNDLDESLDEEVIEETNEYKIVKTHSISYKTKNGVAVGKPIKKEIYQVYFRAQDFNQATNRWMNKGWTLQLTDFKTLEEAREYVKKHDRALKSEVKEDIKNPLTDLKISTYKYLLDVYDKEDNFIERKFFRSRPEADRYVDALTDLYDIKISNNEVIELKSGKQFIGTYWKVIRDMKQEVKEDTNKQYFLCSIYGGYNCQELLADNIEVYAENEEQAKKEAIKIYKQEYNYSRKDNPFGLEAKIIKDDDLEEDIEKHDELNPVLFDGEELKPEIKDALQKIVDTFVEDLKESEVDIKVKDVVLVGSNVSYNYTKDSDLDVHIIADSNGTDYPAELATLLYSAYRGIFNRNYDITLKGVPVEVYVEMDNLGAAKSNGQYSLANGWIKKPSKDSIPDVNLNQAEFDKLFDEWEDKYFNLLDEVGVTPEEVLSLIEKEDEEASEKVKDFIEDIYDLRKTSIATEGEYGVGNLVFKEFRNLGYLDELKSLRKVLKGQELSLENLQEDFSQDALEAIYKYTLDNDGGTFSIKDGKNLSGSDTVKNVYSVEFKSKDWNKRMAQVDKQEVLNALNRLSTSEEAINADAIGTWSSGEKERPQSSVGLDKFFLNREDAEKFALEHKQKAIGVFDANGNYSDTIYKKNFKYKEPKEDK